MTGAEAKAIMLAAYRSTTAAAKALGISRRKLHSLYTLDRVPALYRLALMEIRRDQRLGSFSDVLAQLEAEARARSRPEAP